MLNNAENRNQASNYGEKCPVCGGSGWEVFNKSVEDAAYNTPLVFAKPCHKCAAIRRRYDENGMPNEFACSDITKFGFDAYSVDMSKIKSMVYSFFDRFEKWRLSGKGMYIWSETAGTGKTFLSCCIANSLSIK